MLNQIFFFLLILRTQLKLIFPLHIKQHSSGTMEVLSWEDSEAFLFISSLLC